MSNLAEQIRDKAFAVVEKLVAVNATLKLPVAYDDVTGSPVGPRPEVIIRSSNVLQDTKRLPGNVAGFVMVVNKNLTQVPDTTQLIVVNGTTYKINRVITHAMKDTIIAYEVWLDGGI